MSASASQTNYLIVGAGAFGLSTALALAKAGKKVTVFERSDTIPSVDSASNDINKVVRCDYGNDLLYQGLAIESMRLFRSWNSDCLKQMGNIIYHEVGILNAASEAKAKDASDYNFLSFSSIQRAGYGSYLKRGSQIPSWESLKQLRQSNAGGYYNSLGGWADSGKSIKYIAQKCREAGVNFKLGIPGTLVEFVKEERKTTKVAGIKMKDGSRYFGTIILATGAWSASLLPELKHCLKAVGQPVIHIKVPDECIKLMYRNAPVWALFSEGFYGFPPTKEGIVKIAKHSDGYLNIEKISNQVPSVDDDIESTVTDPSLKVTSDVSRPKTIVSHPETGLDIPLESLYDFKQFLAKNFVFLTDFDITATRMCWYTDTFDGNFFMTKVPQQPNLYLATGGSGHGYKFLPVLGNIMLDVLNGEMTEATQRFAWREPSQVNEGIYGKEQSRSSTGYQPNLPDVEMASAGDLLASVKAKI